MSSDSEGEEDPRFRIPRGDSDEEIDSDCASGPDEAALPSRNSRAPHDTEDESDGDEPGQMLLSDMLASKRGAISATASKLTRGVIPKPSEQQPEFSDDEDASHLPPDAALDSVVYAATQRRDLDRSEIRKARIVDPCFGKERPDAVAVSEELPHDEMLARMLSTIDGDDVNTGGELKELKWKIRKELEYKKNMAEHVPLPNVVNQRIERSLAYRKTKRDVRKWHDTVQFNRVKDQLVFPLDAPPEVRRDTSALATAVVPTNEYELEIENLLTEAGMKSDRVGFDELGDQKITVEELKERRRELARIRSQMFFYDHKMKRIKKIKSRKYRKIMKKEMYNILDKHGHGIDEDEEGESLAIARKRAEERMTLRHKNTSKWVKRQLQRGEANRNPETRAAIEEQLQLHEELRKRQDIIDSSDEEDYGDADPAGFQEEVDALRNEIESGQGSHTGKKKKPKGIMGMKFMQDAQERRRKEAQALLDEMGNDIFEDNGPDKKGKKRKKQSSTGRITFSGAKQPKTSPADDASGKNQVNFSKLSYGDDDDDEEAVASKKRTIAAYSKEDRTHGSNNPTRRPQKFRDVVEEGNTTKVGFTTTLGGKLSVSDSAMVEGQPSAESTYNPWLTGFTSGKEPSFVKEFLTKPEETPDPEITDEGRAEPGVDNFEPKVSLKPPRSTRRVQFSNGSKSRQDDAPPKFGSTPTTETREEVPEAGASGENVTTKKKKRKGQKGRVQNSAAQRAPDVDKAKVETVAEIPAAALPATKASQVVVPKPSASAENISTKKKKKRKGRKATVLDNQIQKTADADKAKTETVAEAAVAALPATRKSEVVPEAGASGENVTTKKKKRKGGKSAVQGNQTQQAGDVDMAKMDTDVEAPAATLPATKTGDVVAPEAGASGENVTTKKKKRKGRKVTFQDNQTQEARNGDKSKIEMVAVFGQETPAPRTSPVGGKEPSGSAQNAGTKKDRKGRKVTIQDNQTQEARNADKAKMEMVARAFAGAGGADEAEFQAAKDEEIAGELPSAKDIGAEVLPGWGSWDGAGTRKKRKGESDFARAARERLEAARSKAVKGRKDGKLKHVILNQKRIKKAAELTLSAVPFPFTSAEQWECEVSAPLTRELQSSASYRTAIKQKVVKKYGQAITPIKSMIEPEDGGSMAKKSNSDRSSKKEVIDHRKEISNKRNASRKGLLA